VAAPAGIVTGMDDLERQYENLVERVRCYPMP
jgi:hypothetical protein